MKLKNKTIIITGGTKGLGRALALSFKKKGANVVVCSRHKDKSKNLKNGILVIKADVTKEKDLQNLLDKTLKKFNKLDIWINNAGLWLSHSSTENFNMSKVKKMFDVNTFGSINGSRVALRIMKKKKTGIIINIISDSALVARPMSSMYATSKWAINGFTKSIREENKDIHILSVYPGGIKTDFFGQNRPNNFGNFMEPDYVAKKIIENLMKENPEEELIIKH